MELEGITRDIGSFTRDAILVTKAQPWQGPDGPEIVWCNRAFTEMTGYTLEDILGRTPRLMQGPDTDPGTLARIRSALESREPIVVTVRNYTKTGDPFWSEISIVPAAEGGDDCRYFVSVQRDVTERVEREADLAARFAALQTSERALQEEKIQLAGIAAVAQHAQDLITITDTEFRILWANPAFSRRSGYAEAMARGTCLFDLLGKRGAVYSSRDVALQEIARGRQGDGEVRNLCRDRTEFWTDLRLSVQRDAEGRPVQFVVVERDITEQRRQRIDLERSRFDLAMAATRDPLTGLPNRLGLGPALEDIGRRAERNGHGLGLLHVDLDHFKQINDTLGHAAGDAVLLEVTRRLMAGLGPRSIVARVGSDDFVIAAELSGEDRDLHGYADHLLRHVGRPVRYRQTDCRFSASIGFTARDQGPFCAEELLVEADIALNRAKAGGRNVAHAFTDALSEQTRARKTLADQLTVAIENGDLFAHYQPQFDAGTGALAGAEALVRWTHPEAGLVGPQHFLGLARELHLEPLIDRMILEQALGDLATFRAAGIALPKISVNVSARRLRHAGLIEELDQLSIAPGDVSFELLESIFLDETDDQLVWSLDAFRERGIDVEIDDFGTGHASIMGLLRIAPQRLKTDRAILAPALEHPRRRRLFGLVVEIGQALDIAVTAEGVETKAHADLARALGCSVLQGYHFAHPMAAADFVSRYGADRASG
jgi:diguanylate cyclase (GGDEF)-like protein/PAS domain S-box-containing protein